MGFLKTIDAKVVGITFKNEDGTDRQEILLFVCDEDPVVIEYYEYRGDPAILSAQKAETKSEISPKN